MSELNCIKNNHQEMDSKKVNILLLTDLCNTHACPYIRFNQGHLIQFLLLQLITFTSLNQLIKSKFHIQILVNSIITVFTITTTNVSGCFFFFFVTHQCTRIGPKAHTEILVFFTLLLCNRMFSIAYV